MMGSAARFVVKCLSLQGFELPLTIEIFEQPVLAILSGFRSRRVYFNSQINVWCYVKMDLENIQYANMWTSAEFFCGGFEIEMRNN